MTVVMSSRQKFLKSKQLNLFNNSVAGEFSVKSPKNCVVM